VGKVQGAVFGATQDELFVLNSAASIDSTGVAIVCWRKSTPAARAGHQGIRYDEASQSAIVTSRADRRERLLRVSGNASAAIVDNIGKFSAGSPAVSQRANLPFGSSPATTRSPLSIWLPAL